MKKFQIYAVDTTLLHNSKIWPHHGYQIWPFSKLTYSIRNHLLYLSNHLHILWTDEKKLDFASKSQIGAKLFHNTYKSDWVWLQQGFSSNHKFFSLVKSLNQQTSFRSGILFLRMYNSCKFLQFWMSARVVMQLTLKERIETRIDKEKHSMSKKKEDSKAP